MVIGAVVEREWDGISGVEWVTCTSHLLVIASHG
jgi:hypothetical protein